MVKVKICGIRTVEDALMAVRLGADAVGVLVGQRYASPDFLKVDIARDIVSALPPFCSSVLVTHLRHAIEILPLLDHVPVTTVQLHSDISPEDCSALKQRHPNRKYIKSIHVIDETSLHIQDPYLDIVDALLLDTVNPSTGQIGGTGLAHDWSLSARLVASSPLPVILAGGLTADNVNSAIVGVHPFGVDVNSGVKNTEGFKDPVKVSHFIQRAKSAM